MAYPRFKGNGRSLGNLKLPSRTRQTGFCYGSSLDSKERLEAQDFVKVVSADPATKRVQVVGTRDPSSESILHYKIYRHARCGAVFHGHDRKCSTMRSAFRCRKLAGRTPGTVELLRQVLDILGNHQFLIHEEPWFSCTWTNDVRSR